MSSAVLHSDAIAWSRETLARHSSSFSLATRLLPAPTRDEARVVYAWCRRVDDAIDGTHRDPAATLDELHDELERIYDGGTLHDPRLIAFRDVTRARRIPRTYPYELLAGMAMDARGTVYETCEDLLLYGFRVAGTVGLMMCHVLGVDRDEALEQGAHLGMAMQLTNIARDVLEDWERGRLYLPRTWLAHEGAAWLPDARGRAFPEQADRPVARVVARLLEEAHRYYRAADPGLATLPWRAALAVRTASRVYGAIGSRVAAQRFDVRAGRAYVGPYRKAALAAVAAVETLGELPRRARAGRRRCGPPRRTATFAHGHVVLDAAPEPAPSPPPTALEHVRHP